MIKTLLLSAVLMVLATTAYAESRTAVSRIDRNVTFTITDEPCVFFTGVPDGAPIKTASAYDAAKNLTIVGCALDYGTQIEFQLVNEAEKKYYQFILPSADFKEVLPI